MDKKQVLIEFNRFSQNLRYVVSMLRERAVAVLNVLSGMACIGVGVLLTLDFGFHLNTSNTDMFAQMHMYLLWYFTLDVGIRFLIQKKRLFYFFSSPLDLLIFYPALYFIPDFPVSYSYFFSQFALLGIMIGRLRHLKFLVNWFRIKPAQLFLLGFVLTVFIGSLLLSLPISTTLPEGISFVDALFTAFSAVCVTGLVVNDVGTTFSLFGQFVILILIQLGGLGIMSFSILIALLLHRKLSQTASYEFQESYATVSLSETFQAISFIFKVTLFAELLGAGFLFFFWMGEFSHWSEALFMAVFHSVSAFCNAGFSLFSDSLMSYAGHFPVMMVVSALIILGGLGFPVLFNLFQNRNQPFRRLKVQTKLALKVTFWLLVFGTMMIYFFERSRSLMGLPVGEQMLISFFQSVSARTAGFNSTDISLFHPATIVGMLVLMLIGASPGSTGGGIKTTTFGLMLVSFWNTMKSSKRIVLSGRRIKLKSIMRAFSLLLLAVMVIVVFFLSLLMLEEDKAFLPLLFETVSAFGTVGYSMGLTADLSNVGKVIIMVLMLIGRIGPLTVAIALSQPKHEERYEYPEEQIIIV